MHKSKTVNHTAELHRMNSCMLPAVRGRGSIFQSFDGVAIRYVMGVYVDDVMLSHNGASCLFLSGNKTCTTSITAEIPIIFCSSIIIARRGRGLLSTIDLLYLRQITITSPSPYLSFRLSFTVSPQLKTHQFHEAIPLAQAQAYLHFLKLCIHDKQPVVRPVVGL